MDLIDLVAEYDNLGYHRTGIYSEPKTERLLCERLTLHGCKIEFHEYPYLLCAADSCVRLNDDEIVSIPLYYESVNAIRNSSNIEIATVNTSEDEIQLYSEIQEITGRAKRNFRDAVVLATRCESDSLHALNVSPARYRSKCQL